MIINFSHGTVSIKGIHCRLKLYIVDVDNIKTVNININNFKVKKLFWFLKIRAFFNHCRLDSLFYQCMYSLPFLTSLNFLNL